MSKVDATREVINMIPDIVGGIDGLSKSPTIWSYVKAGAVVVFIIGGIYYTVRSMWYKLIGVDENEMHRSIYDVKQPTKPAPELDRDSKKDKNERTNDKKENRQSQEKEEQEDNKKEQQDTRDDDPTRGRRRRN